MKKLFALLLAVLMIATMSVTAFAADTTVEDTTSNPTITVTGTYQPGSGTPEEVISVAISWGSMAFTYTAGTQEWDPTTHNYKDTAGTWSFDTDANKITIVNHSNVKIQVQCVFAATAGNDIKGAFYYANGEQAGVPNLSDAINLTSAASDGWLDDPSGPTQTRYFKITEGAISETSNNTLGTITLTITNLGQ